LTPETRFLFGKEAIEKCKDGVIVANMSRCDVMDIAAVNEGLACGKIRGVCTDVVPFKPQDQRSSSEQSWGVIQEFLSRDNVLATPHIGAIYDPRISASVNYQMVEQIYDYLKYGRIKNAVSSPYKVPFSPVKFIMPSIKIAAAFAAADLCARGTAVHAGFVMQKVCEPNGLLDLATNPSSFAKLIMTAGLLAGTAFFMNMGVKTSVDMALLRRTVRRTKNMLKTAQPSG
jgi:hypothetical protein